MKITIIGSGNVAEAIAEAILLAPDDIRLMQVCARNKERGGRLATKYGASYVSAPEEVAKADLYLIAASDSAVTELSARLSTPPDAVVAHTSGGLSIEALQCANRNTAVFYPLQTFSQGRPVDFRQIPVFIEFATPEAGATIHRFASALSDKVSDADSARRNKLHIAAVMACNFTNYLYTIAARFVESEEGLDFSMLKPLIRETAEKAISVADPATVQTGPAIRHDRVTIERHRAILKQEKDNRYLELYTLLSNSIWETLKKT